MFMGTPRLTASQKNNLQWTVEGGTFVDILGSWGIVLWEMLRGKNCAI